MPVPSKTSLCSGLLLGASCILGGTAQAADWSSSNIQLLYGDGYEVNDNSKFIITVEHANGWTYGDNFFFVDISNPIDDGTTYYSEYSPRLSLSKMTGSDYKFGIVKDVLLAGTLEMGEDVRAYLAGVGFALDLPKFRFANLNAYWRQSHRDFASEQTDNGAQITINWNLPFKFGLSWTFEGYMDYAWGEDGGSNPKEDNLVGAPRLLFDLGEVWGVPGTLQAGVEYQIWRNKFGIDGRDEDVAQAMVKWIF